MVKKKILIVEGNTREENSEFTAVGINTHTVSLIVSINFYEKDLVLSKKIIEEDKNINKLSSEVESLAINVIRNQTPVATDIRKLTSHIFVAQELERIGDYLRGISRINIKIGKEPFITKFEGGLT